MPLRNVDATASWSIASTASTTLASEGKSSALVSSAGSGGRQPENRYDALAIEVLGPEGHKLGYVPRRRNEMPARLMDAGKHLSARTESIAQRGSWLNIQVSLYLDDA